MISRRSFIAGCAALPAASALAQLMPRRRFSLTREPNYGAAVLLSRKQAGDSRWLDFHEFSDDFDDYRLEVTRLIPATTDNDLYLRYSSDGDTFLTASNYYWAHFTTIHQGNFGFGPAWGAAQAQLAITDARRWPNANAPGASLNAVLYLVNMRNATKLPMVHGWCQIWNAQDQPQQIAQVSGGYSVAASYVAVRVYAASGNIASGEICLWGLRK